MAHRSCWLLGLMIAGCAPSGTGLMTQFDEAAAHAAPQPAPPDAAQPDPDQPKPAADEPEQPKRVPITKRPARLVDKKKAMEENPKLVEVENKINASDPLTAVARSYFTIGSRAQVLAMQHNINIQREIDGRWPTFEEFEKTIKQNNVKLTGLYAYQMYAYDASTGGLCILEDRAEKKRQYEAAGREYPHDE